MSLSLQELKYCDCGICGLQIPKYNKDGTLRKYVSGHTWKGKKLSEEHRKNLGEARTGEKNHFYGMKHSKESKKKIGISAKYRNQGENNPAYKGDEVGYTQLHTWIKKQFPKPEFCMLCKKEEPKELACITGIYNRELKNWAWFCFRCHKEWDNIRERRKIKMNQKKMEILI